MPTTRFLAASGSAKPVAGGYFQTLPPGSPLPSDSECAARVRRSTWEPRPENAVANNTTPSSLALGNTFPGVSRVTGNFTGTTDEIMQWASCKWGISDDLTRVQAVSESYWKQSTQGDIETDPSHCASGYSVPCPTSFGLLQLRWYFREGSWPWAATSTAFNADYSRAEFRSCYEGTTWLGAQTRGDIDGCLDVYFSGRWQQSSAAFYHQGVKTHLAEKPWLSW